LPIAIKEVISLLKLFFQLTSETIIGLLQDLVQLSFAAIAS
jgi:hypothetical protein